MLYRDINIGDIFEIDFGITYTVVSKTNGLIEVIGSYQHPSLSPTTLKSPGDSIFNKRVYNAGNVIPFAVQFQE